MKKINLLYVFAFIASIFTACEKAEDLAYKPASEVEETSTRVVLLNNPSKTIVVDAATEKTTFTLEAKIWGGVAASDITIPFVLGTTDLPSGALTVTSTDFVIKAGESIGLLTLEIASAPMFPGTVYTFDYSIGTPSSGQVNELGATGTITAFNPGLLGPWVGNYSGAAVSLNEPGDWDESWTVTTELDPNEPLKNILIKGIADSPVGVVATIDIDAGTITIEPGQNIGDVYGYGDSYIYYGEAPYNFYMSPMVGTVEADGTIYIPNMGLTTGPYGWDVFDVTFNMTGKASISIPKEKKPSVKYNL